MHTGPVHANKERHNVLFVPGPWHAPHHYVLGARFELVAFDPSRESEIRSPTKPVYDRLIALLREVTDCAEIGFTGLIQKGFKSGVDAR